MKRKKMKKMLRKKMSAPTPQAFTQQNGDPLDSLMGHTCELICSVYQIGNGFNVVCHRQKYDQRGNTSERVTSIVFVSKLADIPTVMASNGAMNKMGVVL